MSCITDYIVDMKCEYCKKMVVCTIEPDHPTNEDGIITCSECSRGLLLLKKKKNHYKRSVSMSKADEEMAKKRIKKAPAIDFYSKTGELISSVEFNDNQNEVPETKLEVTTCPSCQAMAKTFDEESKILRAKIKELEAELKHQTKE